MAVIESWFTQERTQPVKVRYLDGNVFSMDNNGNLIGIEVLENGEPASLSGSVSASVVRADGATVAVTGAKDGNKCSVILPQACYAVPGVISIVIKLTSGSDIATIGAVVGVVYQSSTDSVVDPGTIIPSISSLIAAIDAAIASIPADYSSLWTSLAPAFSTGTAYSRGQYVTYDGKLWRFTTDHAAGTWDSNHATQTAIGTDLYNIIHSDVLYGTNITITNSNKTAICSGTFDGLPNNKVYSVAGSTLTNSPFSSGFVQIVTLGKTSTRTSGDMQFCIHVPDNLIAFRTYYANTTSWSDWEYPGLQNLTYAYSETPISVAHSSSETVVTIPDTTRILTKEGAILTPSATLTVPQGHSNWISYDKTAEQWVLAYKVANHETYTIGWAGNGIKKSFIAGISSETNSNLQLREWGYIFSPTKLPEIKYGASENTLTIYNSVIAYSGGTISASGQTLTFSSPKWLGYDIDAGEFVLATSVAGHTVILLGVLAESKIEKSFISGTQFIIPKTIAFLGDSITAGSGTSKCFHQYVQDRYGYTCLNYGYGGSGWVRNFPNNTTQGLIGMGNQGRGVQMTVENQFTPNNIIARLAELNPSTLDGVVIAAGTNDWGHSNLISLSDFRSGVDATFEYYFEHFGLVPLLVMLPIHRINDTSAISPGTWTLMDFADALAEECRKYGVPYIDTMSMSGCQPNNTYNAASFFARDDTHQSDGIHPNHYAHERMMRAIGETLNQLLKYDNQCMR